MDCELRTQKQVLNNNRFQGMNTTIPLHNTIYHKEEDFTVLLDNLYGNWKIIEGKQNLDDIKYLLDDLENCNALRRSRVITIFLNNVCNLRCSYCRFDQVTHTGIEHEELSLKKVIRSIHSVCEPNETVEIHFQGGEPLLKYKEIEYVCRELLESQQSTNFRFCLTTNGTICNEEIIKFLLKYKIGVTISLDGPPEIHNVERIYSTGKGSFYKAKRTLEKLRSNNIPIGIFCVIADVDKMMDIYDYFIKELNLKSFVLAPLELDGTQNISDVKVYLKKFFNNQIKIIEEKLDTFKKSRIRIKENLTDLLLIGKIFPSAYSKACGETPYSTCGEKMHSIERNGDILPCQNSRMNFIIDKENMDVCIKRFGLCETCEIRAHCSTPICFTRLNKAFIQSYRIKDDRVVEYVKSVCDLLKEREMNIFNIIYKRKEDIIDYLN